MDPRPFVWSNSWPLGERDRAARKAQGGRHGVGGPPSRVHVDYVVEQPPRTFIGPAGISCVRGFRRKQQLYPWPAVTDVGYAYDGGSNTIIVWFVSANDRHGLATTRYSAVAARLVDQVRGWMPAPATPASPRHQRRVRRAAYRAAYGVALALLLFSYLLLVHFFGSGSW